MEKYVECICWNKSLRRNQRYDARRLVERFTEEDAHLGAMIVL
jgi:hypothetical protein